MADVIPARCRRERSKPIVGAHRLRHDLWLGVAKGLAAQSSELVMFVRDGPVWF
jgi:hypothetical protein